MRFSITTLGCKVNAYESQFYAEELKKLGFTEVEDDQESDICIINTCTVTNTAAHKSRQKIHQAKKKNPHAYCVVVGCYAQFSKEKERDELDADLVIGANHKNQLASLVQEMVAKDKKQDVVNDLVQFNDFEAMPIHYFGSKHRAFLKVEDGCNQFCSYCAIPFARGRERSLKYDQVLSIAQELVKKGHSEIVLTGIHTGRYKDGSLKLADLLKGLLESTPDTVYYRISSIEITEVDHDLIDLMKENRRICRHLHIPIQSACDETLKRMHRPYTVDEFKEHVAWIRKELPDISFSTDVIAGFVQESDQEFETTYNNLADIAFSFLHVFPYSKRNGTAASQMKGEVNGKIAKERVAKLLALSKQLRLNDMKRFQPVEVLIEKHEGNVYTGYTNQYHPIRIESDTPLEGRITLRWTSIDEDGYLVRKVDENAIK